jgi:hypothetical protein
LQVNPSLPSLSDPFNAQFTAGEVVQFRESRLNVDVLVSYTLTRMANMERQL